MADNTVDTNVVVEGTVVEANVEARTRRSPDMKDKTVEFTMSKELRLADLVEAGYQRREVEHFFLTLEAAGLGTYEKGRLGRGCSAKFVCNDGFPEKYCITVQVRRLRQDYVGKPVVVENKPAESVVIDAQDSWLTNGAENAQAEPVADVPVADVPAEVVDVTVEQ